VEGAGKGKEVERDGWRWMQVEESNHKACVYLCLGFVMWALGSNRTAVSMRTHEMVRFTQWDHTLRQ
jgi:hypothetical protein